MIAWMQSSTNSALNGDVKRFLYITPAAQHLVYRLFHVLLSKNHEKCYTFQV